MLISNLRNKGDLEAKKRLRDDLLELEKKYGNIFYWVNE